jgi:RNA polymerase sigma-70 factor (ECF subfamily)
MAMNVTEVVWKEYHAKLHTFVRRRIDDHAIVDDIIQDVFLKTYIRLSSLKDEATLESWLYQITRNAVIDHYRTQKPSEELPEWISQPETNLNDQAKQDLETCLMPMINQLPAHYREALILSEIYQKPQKEVAKEQKISLSGAKS